MTLDPVLSASTVIQLHVLAAVPALLVGPFALFRRRRDRVHKAAGRLWVAAMAALAITGLFIPSHGLTIVGPFGPIHVLCVVTLWGIVAGVLHARSGRFAAHEETMRGLWFGAMGVAGLFTLMPGRILNGMIFGAVPDAGVAAIALGLTALAWLWWRGSGRGRVAA